MKQSEIKLQEYKEAYRRFSEVAELDVENFDLILQEGFVQRSRVLLGAAENLISTYMLEQGSDEGRCLPRNLMKHADRLGYLRDGQIWLDALRYRTNTTFDFDENLVKEMVSFLKHTFYDEVKYVCFEFEERLAS